MKYRTIVTMTMTLFMGTLLLAQTLEESFKSPPDSAKPYTWWHWQNGNISKEGITKDLESMKAVGIAGFQLFDVNWATPAGPIVHNTPEFHDMVKFAFSEADRLGLEAGIHNCSGWANSGGPWITPDKSMKMVVWSETQVNPSNAQPVVLSKGDFRGKITPKRVKVDYYKDIAVLAFPTPKHAEYRIENWLMKGLYDWASKADLFVPELKSAPASAVIKADHVLDVTHRMKADGTLDWTPEKGEWTVLRFGYRSIGSLNKTAANGGQGLEVDKLSRDAVEFHWNTFVEKLIQDAAGTSSLTDILIDSYEVGMQNWTERFAEEFHKRRGYDLLPMMVALTGRVLENTETTERVLWDLRVTVSELMHENYFGTFAEKCREQGFKYSVEPYGSGTFDAAKMTLMADVSMTEFWQNNPDRNLWIWTSQIVSSGAHLSGNPIVGAEAFTAMSGDWQAHPGGLKKDGDLAFIRGVNRYYFHSFAHQPFHDSVQPGMVFGRFGGNFHRNNTWFLKSRDWMDYIARCQFLMQSGTYQADVLALYGDERGFISFLGGDEPPDMNEIPGLSFDLGGMASLDDLSVDDEGVIRVTHKGKRLDTGYQLLLFKRADVMLPERVAKIGKLADQGAKIFAPKPLRSPSYSNHKQADAELSALVKKYWDSGLIQLPDAFDAAVARLTKDCELPESMLFNHHRIGADDFYFLSNQKEEARAVTAAFRISGKQPELWDPLTGNTQDARNWKALKDGRTEVRFDMPATGSLFVAFREPTSSKGKSSPPLKSKGLMTLDTDWSVAFDPKWGPAKPVRFSKLIPWNEHANEAIKYFSGSAVYRKTFTLPRIRKGASLKLDLGQVDVMARVKLNGKDLGLLWCSPFQVDISEPVKPGNNQLEIEVTNLWINRMIGDAAFPYDKKIYNQIRDGQPLPASSKRKTFQFHVKNVHPKKNDALRSSGLIGPVRIMTNGKNRAERSNTF